MNIDDFKSACESIRHEIYSLETNNPNLQAMPDGIINIDKYLNSKYKILWILKEPYDALDDDGLPSGGGFSIDEALNLKENGTQFGRSSMTYLPMIHTSYGILNDFLYWDEFLYADKSLEVFQALKSIAYINVKKIPGKTQSSSTEIQNAYKINRDLLLKQINLYNPDIIIGGNTLHYFFKDLNIPENMLERNGSLRYITLGKKLYIDAYHPAQRGNVATKEIYSNEIIETVAKWSEII